MLFNSIQFLVFFIVVTSLYYSLPYRFRWIMLLAASCYFYMAFVPIYILILGFTIAIEYFAGIFIESTEGKKRKLYLICSLVANIGVLALFKYYNFLNDNLTLLLGHLHVNNPIPILKILLPIGLSFHTFQAMSYTIEVYRGKQKAERNFGMYSLYVMFYPQLGTGPIERPQNLLPQLKAEHPFDSANVTSGLRLIAWGLFKKVVIADRLAILVDNVYSKPHHYNGISLAIATLFFTYQIYCDFSGYTDIAIGTARVMGIKLMQNFNNPFQAKSLPEFWTRWHISLSTWFRDYLYIPLGGNRVALPRHLFNLFFVFLIGGLWHGAHWTFIAWGALHGFYLIFGFLTKKPREKNFYRNWYSKVLNYSYTHNICFGKLCLYIFPGRQNFRCLIYCRAHIYKHTGTISFQAFTEYGCIKHLPGIFCFAHDFSRIDSVPKRKTFSFFQVSETTCLY